MAQPSPPIASLRGVTSASLYHQNCRAWRGNATTSPSEAPFGLPGRPRGAAQSPTKSGADGYPCIKAKRGGAPQDKHKRAGGWEPKSRYGTRKCPLPPGGVKGEGRGDLRCEKSYSCGKNISDANPATPSAARPPYVFLRRAPVYLESGEEGRATGRVPPKPPLGCQPGPKGGSPVPVPTPCHWPRPGRTPGRVR